MILQKKNRTLSLHLWGSVARKTGASLTVCLFIFNVCFSESAIAQMSSKATSPFSSQQPYPDDLSTIQLPEGMGKIEDSYYGNAEEYILLIQDAHAIPEAQRNIRNIIDYFSKFYGLKTIAFEGADQNLNPQFFRSFPDKSLLKKIFKTYLDQGELTGTTMAAIFNESEANYIGIENWDLFEEGYSFYLDAQSKANDLNAQIKIKEEELNNLKKQTYTEQALKLDQTLKDFRDNEKNIIELINYLSLIKPPISNSEIDLIQREQERSGHEEIPIEIEVKKLAQVVESGLRKNDVAAMGGREVIASFNEKMQAYQLSQISPEEFAIILKELTSGIGLKIKLSKKLEQLMQQHKRLRDIEGTRFYEDLQKYIDQVKAEVLTHKGEKELDLQTEQLEVLKKINQLELAPDQWGDLKESKGIWSARESKYQDLLDNMRSHYSFYRNAEERDEVFISKLDQFLEKEEKTPSLSGKSKKVIAFVSGGFHSKSLREKLRQENTSYILLTPTIQALPEEINYKKQMLGQVPWSAYFEVRDGLINIADAFARYSRDQLLKDGQSEQRFLLKQWRDQILRDLAGQNKINQAKHFTKYLDEIIKPSKQKNLLEEKIKNFSNSLRSLEDRGLLNQENVMNLLRPSLMTSSATYLALVDRPITLPLVLRENERAELRSQEIRSETRISPAEVSEIKKRYEKKVEVLKKSVKKSFFKTSKPTSATFQYRYSQIFEETIREVLEAHESIAPELRNQVAAYVLGSVARRNAPYGTDIDVFILVSETNPPERNVLDSIKITLNEIIDIGVDFPVGTSDYSSNQGHMYSPSMDVLKKDLNALEGVSLRSLLDRRFIYGESEINEELQVLLISEEYYKNLFVWMALITDGDDSDSIYDRYESDVNLISNAVFKVQQSNDIESEKIIKLQSIFENEFEIRISEEQALMLIHERASVDALFEVESYIVNHMEYLAENQKGKSEDLFEFNPKKSPGGLRTIQMIGYLGRLLFEENEKVYSFDYAEQSVTDLFDILSRESKREFLNVQQVKKIKEAHQFFLDFRTALNLVVEKRKKAEKKDSLSKESMSAIADLFGTSAEELQRTVLRHRENVLKLAQDTVNYYWDSQRSELRSQKIPSETRISPAEVVDYYLDERRSELRMQDNPFQSPISVPTDKDLLEWQETIERDWGKGRQGSLAFKKLFENDFFELVGFQDGMALFDYGQEKEGRFDVDRHALSLQSNVFDLLSKLNDEIRKKEKTIMDSLMSPLLVTMLFSGPVALVVASLTALIFFNIEIKRTPEIMFLSFGIVHAISFVIHRIWFRNYRTEKIRSQSKTILTELLGLATNSRDVSNEYALPFEEDPRSELRQTDGEAGWFKRLLRISRKETEKQYDIQLTYFGERRWTALRAKDGLSHQYQVQTLGTDIPDHLFEDYVKMLEEYGLDDDDLSGYAREQLEGDSEFHFLVNQETGNAVGFYNMSKDRALGDSSSITYTMNLIFITKAYRGTGAADVLYEDMIETYFKGDRDAKFWGSITRDHKRAKRDDDEFKFMTLADRKEALGMISDVKISDLRSELRVNQEMEVVNLDVGSVSQPIYFDQQLGEEDGSTVYLHPGSSIGKNPIHLFRKDENNLTLTYRDGEQNPISYLLNVSAMGGEFTIGRGLQEALPGYYSRNQAQLIFEKQADGRISLKVKNLDTSRKMVLGTKKTSPTSVAAVIKPKVASQASLATTKQPEVVEAGASFWINNGKNRTYVVVEKDASNIILHLYHFEGNQIIESETQRLPFDPTNPTYSFGRRTPKNAAHDFQINKPHVSRFHGSFFVQITSEGKIKNIKLFDGEPLENDERNPSTNGVYTQNFKRIGGVPGEPFNTKIHEQQGTVLPMQRIHIQPSGFADQDTFYDFQDRGLRIYYQAETQSYYALEMADDPSQHLGLALMPDQLIEFKARLISLDDSSSNDFSQRIVGITRVVKTSIKLNYDGTLSLKSDLEEGDQATNTLVLTHPLNKAYFPKAAIIERFTKNIIKNEDSLDNQGIQDFLRAQKEVQDISSEIARDAFIDSATQMIEAKYIPIREARDAEFVSVYLDQIDTAVGEFRPRVGTFKFLESALNSIGESASAKIKGAALKKVTDRIESVKYVISEKSNLLAEFIEYDDEYTENQKIYDATLQIILAKAQGSRSVRDNVINEHIDAFNHFLIYQLRRGAVTVTRLDLPDGRAVIEKIEKKLVEQFPQSAEFYTKNDATSDVSKQEKRIEIMMRLLKQVKEDGDVPTAFLSFDLRSELRAENLGDIKRALLDLVSDYYIAYENGKVEFIDDDRYQDEANPPLRIDLSEDNKLNQYHRLIEALVFLTSTEDEGIGLFTEETLVELFNNSASQNHAPFVRILDRLTASGSQIAKRSLKELLQNQFFNVRELNRALVENPIMVDELFLRLIAGEGMNQQSVAGLREALVHYYPEAAVVFSSKMIGERSFNEEYTELRNMILAMIENIKKQKIESPWNKFLESLPTADEVDVFLQVFMKNQMDDRKRSFLKYLKEYFQQQPVSSVAAIAYLNQNELNADKLKPIINIGLSVGFTPSIADNKSQKLFSIVAFLLFAYEKFKAGEQPFSPMKKIYESAQLFKQTHDKNGIRSELRQPEKPMEFNRFGNSLQFGGRRDSKRFKQLVRIIEDTEIEVGDMFAMGDLTMRFMPMGKDDYLRAQAMQTNNADNSGGLALGEIFQVQLEYYDPKNSKNKEGWVIIPSTFFSHNEKYFVGRTFLAEEAQQATDMLLDLFVRPLDLETFRRPEKSEARIAIYKVSPDHDGLFLPQSMLDGNISRFRYHPDKNVPIEDYRGVSAGDEGVVVTDYARPGNVEMEVFEGKNGEYKIKLTATGALNPIEVAKSTKFIADYFSIEQGALASAVESGDRSQFDVDEMSASIDNLRSFVLRDEDLDPVLPGKPSIHRPKFPFRIIVQDQAGEIDQSPKIEIALQYVNGKLVQYDDWEKTLNRVEFDQEAFEKQTGKKMPFKVRLKKLAGRDMVWVELVDPEVLAQFKLQAGYEPRVLVERISDEDLALSRSPEAFAERKMPREELEIVQEKSFIRDAKAANPDFHYSSDAIFVGNNQLVIGKNQKGEILIRILAHNKAPEVLIFPSSSPINIGRSSSNDVLLDASKVSRYHAVIIPIQGQRLFINDMGSTNGTFVNGKRLEKIHELNFDSGRAELRFTQSDLKSIFPSLLTTIKIISGIEMRDKDRRDNAIEIVQIGGNAFADMLDEVSSASAKPEHYQKEQERLLEHFRARFGKQNITFGVVFPETQESEDYGFVRRVADKILSLNVLRIFFEGRANTKALRDAGLSFGQFNSGRSITLADFDTVFPVSVLAENYNLSHFNAMYFPVGADKLESIDDPFLREHIQFMQLLATATASALLQEQPELKNQPDLLKGELIKALGMISYEQIVAGSARGVVIDATALTVYMKMLAAQAVRQSA